MDTPKQVRPEPQLNAAFEKIAGLAPRYSLGVLFGVPSGETGQQDTGPSRLYCLAMSDDSRVSIALRHALPDRWRAGRIGHALSLAGLGLAGLAGLALAELGTGGLTQPALAQQGLQPQSFPSQSRPRVPSEAPPRVQVQPRIQGQAFPQTGVQPQAQQVQQATGMTPREAANRLIVAARKRYNAGLAAPQPRVRLTALLEARQALLGIIDRFPTTDHAVTLIGGDSVAGLSLPMVEEAIRATQTLVASDQGGSQSATPSTSGAPDSTASLPRTATPNRPDADRFDPDLAARREWENRTGQPFPDGVPESSGQQIIGQPGSGVPGLNTPAGPAEMSSVACDQLAASPNDTTRTAPGVWHGAIDSKRAIEACAQAVALFPVEPRFAYQHGRALYSANRFGEAFAMFQRAATSGHKTARAQVAMMTLAGLGTVQDEPTAIAGLNAAAADDTPFATAILGELHMAGRGVPKDGFKGLGLMRQAAEAGNPFAMQRMGQMLTSGTQTEAKDQEALVWLQKAARENGPEALHLLGVFHRDGRAVEPDADKAFQFFRRAAEMGQAAAAYQVGVAAYQRGGETGLSEGLSWMEKAAAGGETASFYTLAYAYGFGHGTERNARTSADYMFRALASGSSTALTQMTENPEQWPRDMRRALQIKLQEARLYRSSLDGNFGPATVKAIADLAKRAEQKTAATDPQ
jgi:TPR repeat protein